MKLELADFSEMVKKVNKFPLVVEGMEEKLLEMVKDYDEIIYTKPVEYYDVYDALIWLSRLKDRGKRMTLSKETVQNILAPLKGDRWVTIGEWLIRLNRKR